MIRVVAATNFKNYRDLSADPTERCAALVQAVGGQVWEQLRGRRMSPITRRCSGVSAWTWDARRRPATPRTSASREFAAGNDPHLVALVFQYGRYLLIGSSRPGGQPANLQGIWNDKLRPPWDSKYTCNINTEMNYWPAEVTALGECHEPLFAALAELADSGRIVAKEHYNARGWVLASQLRSLARRAPDQRLQPRHLGRRQRLDGHAPVGTLPLHDDRQFLDEDAHSRS